MTCEAYISPNVEWSLEPSTWFGQSLLTFTIWFIFAQLFTKQVAWSLTICLYNLITYVFFHAILGDPFNQEYAGLTFWEQLVIQLEGSSGITFFTVFPILLFLIGARMAQFSNLLFVVNLASLAGVILPKVLVYARHYRSQAHATHLAEKRKAARRGKMQ